MSKPLLEIRCPKPLHVEQADYLLRVLEDLLGKDYTVILLDDGMSANIHDGAILSELREIKEILKSKA